MKPRNRLASVTRAPSVAYPSETVLLPPEVSRGLNAYGEVFFRDQFFPLDHKHGRFRLEAALACDADLLDRLGPGLRPEHVRAAAYLDIETAGMSGAGTCAFMVGVGTFEGFWFRVRQYILREPGEERAMLAGLSETIERCQSIVTFNGKSFDIPRLATRYAVARLPDPHAGLPHIDLLQPARRLFSRSLESCRLTAVERHLLRFRRYGDIPGAQIPGVYVSYLQRHNPRGLHPVFEHNSQDVLSLVALMAYLNEAAGTEVAGSAGHHYRLGRWDEKRDRTAPALENHRLAWEGDAHGNEGGEAILRLTRGLMRSGDWRQSLDLWRRELENTSRTSRRIRACIELSKLYEHRLRAPHEAMRLCRQGIELIDASPSRRSFEVSRDELERRLQRVETRIQSTASKQGVPRSRHDAHRAACGSV